MLQTILRRDYAPTPYLVDTVYLDFNLEEESTAVKSRLHVKPNYGGKPPEMSLDGKWTGTVLQSTCWGLRPKLE